MTDEVLSKVGKLTKGADRLKTDCLNVTKTVPRLESLQRRKTNLREGGGWLLLVLLGLG